MNRKKGRRLSEIFFPIITYQIRMEQKGNDSGDFTWIYQFILAGNFHYYNKYQYAMTDFIIFFILVKISGSLIHNSLLHPYINLCQFIT